MNDGTQTELAERLGVSSPRVNELVHGKRDMTPDTALRLERLRFPVDLRRPIGASLNHAASRAPPAAKLE